MTIIKVSEASGPALEWMVAKCEGVYLSEPTPLDTGCMPFHPSTDWAQGGPIIERERINTNDNGSDFSCYYSRGKTVGQRWGGTTPLVAAMRCYVVSKLGDTVDVPMELLK